MKILRIAYTSNSLNLALVDVRIQGTRHRLFFPLPAEWGSMSRSEKIAWAKSTLSSHLTTNTYLGIGEHVYPDEDVQTQAVIDFENLPGWATWTAAEAAAWIDANVSDLASARSPLAKMAQAIVYLRDIVIER